MHIMISLHYLYKFCSQFFKFMLFLYVLTDSVGVDGAGLVPWVRGPPRCFFSFLPKRSNPKPDQHRKDIIQQNSLGTDML